MSHTPISKEHLEEIIDNICSINSDAPELKSITVYLEFEKRDMNEVIVAFINRKFKIKTAYYGEHFEDRQEFIFSWPNKDIYITFI